VSTDHRAELLDCLDRAKAAYSDNMIASGDGLLRLGDRYALALKLAGHCPDPDAHRVSVTTYGPQQVAPNIWTHTAPDAHQTEDTSGHVLDWAVQVVQGNGLDVVPEATRKRELEELAEARAAARPAPIGPEVVAAIEAAEDWASNARRAREHLSHTGTALLAKVEALPEDWRDGAAVCEHCRTGQHGWHLNEGRCAVGGCDCPAPAAVPAVLDEAGIERAARVLGGANDATWGSWGDEGRKFVRDNAREVVRAYLGDTEIEKETR
jgi:hypothetical protein